MPCFSIETTTVKLKSENTTLLAKALEESKDFTQIRLFTSVGARPAVYGSVDGVPFTVRDGTVTIEGNQAKAATVANAINRAYSRHVVTSQAKRYGYRVTEVKPDEFEFVKA